MRALASILLIPMFKEVRPSEPISKRKLLWRITCGEPIFEQFGPLMDLVAFPIRRPNDNKKDGNE
jgi:hypothetical protein